MQFPDQTQFIGSMIPDYFPLLLILLIILNLWNVYGCVKRRIGFDEYLSSSNHLYSKIIEKSDTISTEKLNKHVSMEEAKSDMEEK